MDHQDAKVKIYYTNHEGQTAWRTISVIQLRYCVDGNAYHKGPLHLLDAYDHDRQAERSFAMRDIHQWEELS